MNQHLHKAAVILAAMSFSFARPERPKAPPPQEQPQQTADQKTVLAGATFRLKKLHLVRPDLAPYPTIEEFFC